MNKRYMNVFVAVGLLCASGYVVAAEGGDGDEDIPQEGALVIAQRVQKKDGSGLEWKLATGFVQPGEEDLLIEEAVKKMYERRGEGETYAALVNLFSRCGVTNSGGDITLGFTGRQVAYATVGGLVGGAVVTAVVVLSLKAGGGK